VRAPGKNIVVFHARPKMETRPQIDPIKAGASSKAAIGKTARTEPVDDDDDDDEDDDE